MFACYSITIPSGSFHEITFLQIIAPLISMGINLQALVPIDSQRTAISPPSERAALVSPEFKSCYFSSEALDSTDVLEILIGYIAAIAHTSDAGPCSWYPNYSLAAKVVSKFLESTESAEKKLERYWTCIQETFPYNFTNEFEMSHGQDLL